MSLPIYELQSELLDALAEGERRVVLQAPTGSGKSTQVPQMLADHPDFWKGMILVLQPRRLAARMLARRVAQEMSCKLGDEVGYQVRFEDRSGPKTRIKFVTEGILLRLLLRNPNLEGISAVLFDEFHERNLFTDVSLARLKRLQEDSRQDLLLLVMSATLATGPVCDYLEPASLFTSKGRTYPVDIHYLPPAKAKDTIAAWDKAATAFDRLMQQGAEGDVLVFMPGAYEIQRTVDAIKRCKSSKGFDVMALHGEMSNEQQDRAVGKSATRKVVVSTNVAETSLTIDGVRIVIDSGLAKIARFDPYRGVNTLSTQKISKASADQRSGRAGRTSPGVCIRCWSEKTHAHRAQDEVPEIRRVDLAEVILSLKADGVNDVDGFPWFEAPDPKALTAAKDLLLLLGATEGPEQCITDLGKQMLRFPLHPRYARMMLEAQGRDCLQEMALVSAIAHSRPFLLRRVAREIQQRREAEWTDQVRSDFSWLIQAWSHASRYRFDLEACRSVGIHAQAARQVAQLYQQFTKVAERNRMQINTIPADEDELARCLLIGFSDQLALRRDETTSRCLLSGGRKGKVDPESVIPHSPLFVSADIREVERRNDSDVLLNLNTAIEREWLEQLLPEFFGVREGVEFDTQARRVVSRQQTVFRDLVLEEKPGEMPSAEGAAELLAEEVLAGNLKLRKWNDKVENWIARVNCVAKYLPELGFEHIGEEEIRLVLQQICLGGTTYKDIRDRDPWPMLRSLLLPGLAGVLDQYTPERFNLPRNRSVKVRYGEGERPVVAARVQELYDLDDVSLASGRIPCRIEILAPNQRPVQITDDLKGFWENSYAMVKKDLAGRYPKHEWR